MDPLYWEYSRNRRRHVVDDGTYYLNEYGLFEIHDCASYKFNHVPSDGYDLLYKGIKIKHAKTVKELKAICAHRLNKL